ncbi:UvrABC system protein B [Marine Group I thaumarchaeote SCGC AAA799-E16]|uniref:UvrABC system protein B n=4 Tax=Marine Group I TaxID=905826 RepID=A0A081RMA4_9ARCH|nr:UvrABC system protein B [Marine Group I thaumarchaeote SCGC AAA799-N04]KER06652.1 UvrABC system protein B [Marine Group I thaumarchaeote SCGC AAA799-E16]KFM16129.1 UvrABC system protein B [Marine Group I thaumarchaeote SCGC AAA799-D11]KFM17866.1 UvrABC system protein B [Marine Group I thaumarchaeote SCGC RSA3]
MEQITQFELASEYAPTGDQPQAIDALVKGVKNKTVQTLLGVTGSGKTFSVANVIARTGKNTLVISHNKTLAAQLYSELKQFFPKNNVGYFVSYYDYYQPESYLPQTDTYIEKDTQVNEKIEKLRLEATAMLLSGEPTIIVSTVSCIYSLGNPQDWEDLAITVNTGDEIKRNELIRQLVDARYERNDTEVAPGNFRVKGDTIDITPAYSEDLVRISMFGDEVEKISVLDHVSLKEKKKINQMKIFPAKHYLIAKDVRKKAVQSIKDELKRRLPELNELEKQRLEMRTKYDLEMIEELGYCSGIENYSRHFDGRKVGEKAFCLMDFFGDDYLLVIDESHVTLPQLHGMYKGDHSRKKELVTYGFRLPSAYDNRPLKFEEFEKYIQNTIFVSATPAEYEKKISTHIAEQLVRPTGLLDPEVEIRPTKNQMDDLIQEINKKAANSERVLVTTLTKRMAEDLAEYLSKKQVRVRYMHSEIEGLQRTELIRQLRLGEFDVLVGINLLREGLDIPEVSLVAILDADKEGFLRNFTSLIQTFGRAARNENGNVIMYADTITQSMKNAMDETKRRREKQMKYNKEHDITPKTIIKSVPEQVTTLDDSKLKSTHDIAADIIDLEAQMKKYSEDLDFERAIECRDKIKRLEKEIQLKNDRK